jgi:hypothetical protein
VGIPAVATGADLNAICIIAQLTRSGHLIHSEKLRNPSCRYSFWYLHLHNSCSTKHNTKGIFAKFAKKE